MAQWAKVFAWKSEDLSSIPGTQVKVEVENAIMNMNSSVHVKGKHLDLKKIKTLD